MELHLFNMFVLLLFFKSFTSVYGNYDSSFFINCGSSTAINYTYGTNEATFVGDVKPSTFHLYAHRSKIFTDPDPALAPLQLYTTARVFTKPSSYAFKINKTGVYILRFHFFAFLSSPPLSKAQFNVSAAGHMLLPGFTVGNNATDSPIKEFLVDIESSGEFRVHFIPVASFGFVNAIELFSTNLNFSKVQMKSNVLEKIYRINVGDREVNSTFDSLGRTWVEDDPYLVSKSDAKNESFYISEINYGSGAANPDDAPNNVYKTAKILNKNGIYNLTWEFNAINTGVHLVRLHFCDIIGSLGSYLINIYMNGNLTEANLDPFMITSRNEAGVPFYRDYIVEVGNAEMIKVSLESRNVSSSGIFLNGLEIMQLKNLTALDPSDNDGSSHLKVIVSVVVAAVVLIVALIAVVLFKWRRKSISVEESEWGMIPMYGVSSNHKSSKTSSSHASNLQNMNLGLKISFAYIQKVTNNFDASLIIGEGGFGKVYKAVFKDGIKVAVKRSSPEHGQGFEEFQTEIMVLSSLRHRHLVSLIGYCYEDDEMILVYEFMEKGTLRDHLYDAKGIAVSSNCLGLSWIKRLEICIGAAEGLHYLHTGSDRGIIHRDVKSTNILLDDHYVAKVADFGLSRLCHLEQSYISTDVKGTFGYLDPEYYGCMQLTEKSDVYSFGVVLLEVLCARPVINRSLPGEQVNLAVWGMICIEQGKVENIIDPSIAGEVTQTALTKFAEAVAKCLKEVSSERPPMSDVIWELKYALLLQRAATEGEVAGDTMTDASLIMPVPGNDQVFSSMSFSDLNDDVTITSTREVSSQLKV